jgi:NADPH-dependent 2,4-dienoyl-CoA reductase/sulfur reductase-like enzyme
MQSVFRNGKIEYLVNPVLGREKELILEPADKPKKVLIVVGGPGGMNASHITLKKGHLVDIYYKNSQLGWVTYFGIKPFSKKN